MIFLLFLFWAWGLIKYIQLLILINDKFQWGPPLLFTSKKLFVSQWKSRLKQNTSLNNCGCCAYEGSRWLMVGATRGASSTWALGLTWYKSLRQQKKTRDTDIFCGHNVCPMSYLEVGPDPKEARHHHVFSMHQRTPHLDLDVGDITVLLQCCQMNPNRTHCPS